MLPDDRPLSNCPVDNCYSLKRAFMFANDFFTSETRLALIQGTHIITDDLKEVLIVKECITSL